MRHFLLPCAFMLVTSVPGVAASQQPAPPATSAVGPAGAAPDARSATLHLASNMPEAAFRLEGGKGGLSDPKECAAPCTTTLPVGPYRLSMTKGSRASAYAERPVVVAGDANVEATYVSNASYRLGAVVVAGIGLVAGGLLMSAKEPVCHTDNCTEERKTSYVLGGLGLMAAAGALAVVIWRNDRFELSITPATTKPLARRTESPGAILPDGVALNAAF